MLIELQKSTLPIIMRLIILFFCLTFSCAKSQTSISSLEKTPIEGVWEPYNAANFTINRLSTWEISSENAMGTSFIIYLPEQAEVLNFRKNITLIIQDFKGQIIDLDQFVSISEEQIVKLMTNSHINESQRLNNEEFQSHKIIFSSDQGIYKLKFEQRYIIHDGKAYILTFTALKDEFDLYTEDITKSFNSFRFIE
jgi:uncharacterized protein YjfI (DUF2170 family)